MDTKAASKLDSSTPSRRCDPEQLIREHQAAVWRYLRAIGCEAALADDLTQETFLVVLRRPFDDYDPAKTAAYLRKVARNFFISTQRRAGKVTPVADVEGLDQAWTRWAGYDDGNELLDVLRECLSALSDRARLALQLRFRDHQSRVNIAAALGITDHGARNLLQRAKQQLRKCVEEKLG
jgi:RNA polymerase sigma-70 factor, ECF subfamily